MRVWLSVLPDLLERGEGAVLVHVAELRGSGPREPGAQMLVTESAIFGTIGGGELEHMAVLRARRHLNRGGAEIVRLALGPELNQCCGGAVTLLFEPFAPADRAWVGKLSAACAQPEPVFRTLRLDTAGAVRRGWHSGGGGQLFSAEIGTDTVEIRERMNAPTQAVWVFGAGHVGRALVQALGPLGYTITWIDARAGQFPENTPATVKTMALAMPELAVEEAPEGTMFLVMTHSHPLDEAICEAVLRRGGFAYLGLIGSATKRTRFRRRLAESGIPAPALDRLVCPIGLPGIRSKEPAAIAASVAADLLLRREQPQAHANSPAQHGR